MARIYNISDYKHLRDERELFDDEFTEENLSRFKKEIKELTEKETKELLRILES